MKNYATGEMPPEELKAIADNIILTQKRFFTSEEAAKYLGISKSYLYKLTYRKQIPHYKPIGKMCYFEREELEKWLQRNRIATDEELNQRAQSYCMKKGGTA